MSDEKKGGTAMNGAEYIADERRRQIDVEGYDAKHDRGNADDLALAGAAYAIPATETIPSGVHLSGRIRFWPWALSYWKPSPDDRIRELVKAGALIAAAIDVLLEETAP